MVVDDDYVNALLARKMLETLGYEVFVAWGGEEALDIVKSESIDLILMDINMPGEDGLQATARIIDNKTTQMIPVIALTADSNTIERGLHTKAGMKDFILKPFKLEQLRDKIQQYL